MLLTIGLYTYLLSKTCIGMGDVAYPIEDKDNVSRIICVDTTYGQDQTKQIFIHEVLHACLHNHKHTFQSKKDLADHIAEIDKQSEEAIVSHLSFCLVSALEQKDVAKFFGIEWSYSNGSSGRSMFSQSGQTFIKDKSRYSNRIYGKRTTTFVEESHQ